MKHVFAVTNSCQLEAYQQFLDRNLSALETFLSHLRAEYAVLSLPRAILWTDLETATNSISDIPIPAYTNDYRTVFCPELEVWKEIYLHQLDEFPHSAIREYYETGLTENHVLQILGHEFVHHSEFFPEGDYQQGIWFEEGMCEYISRKYFLTDVQFQEEARINRLLVELLQETYGGHSLEEFGAATYAGDYASIFYEYWRSFLAVEKIVEQYSGDVAAVFTAYHRWLHSGQDETLLAYFQIDI